MVEFSDTQLYILEDAKHVMVGAVIFFNDEVRRGRHKARI